MEHHVSPVHRLSTEKPLESQSTGILHKLLSAGWEPLVLLQLFNLFVWIITFHLFINFTQKSYGKN